MQKNPDPQTGPLAQEDADDIDLMGLVRALWRGKFLIALCAFVVGAYGWYQANVVAVPIYSASSSLMVETATGPAMDMNSFYFGGARDSFSRNTEMEVIRSRALIGQLVDRLDLVSDPRYNFYLATPVTRFGLRDIPGWVLNGFKEVEAPAAEPVEPPDLATQREGTISSVQGMISASAADMSYLFTISATTMDRDEAVRLANAMAGVYRDDQMAEQVAAAETAAVWLSERTTELRQEVDGLLAEINDLRATNLLTNDAGMTSLNTQLTELETRRLDTDRALLVAGRALEAIVAAADLGPVEQAEAANDAQLRAMATAAAGDDSVARMRFDQRFGQLRQQAQGERDRLAALSAALSEDAARIGAQIAVANESLGTIRQKEREAQSAQLLYDSYMTQFREATMRLGSQQPEVRILSEAIGAGQIAPRKMRILAMHLAFGLLVGTGIVLLREFLHNTFRNSDDLEQRTGIAVLGQIPRIPARGRAGTIGYLSDKPTSAAAEAVRNLRTSVLLSNVDRPPRVILSTSSVPGEGKTTLAIALAQNLAGLDRKVILIEGDIRRRTFTNYFPDAAKNAGILSVISGKVPLADAVWRHPDLGIEVLMGEKSAINAADVFSSDRFRALVEELRATYDYVVIDTPPVLVVPDARVIAPMADAVVYSVAWDRTSRSQVGEGLKQLRMVNVAVTGLVLSQIDPKGMRRYGYGGNYGAYSRYAKGYYEA